MLYYVSDHPSKSNDPLIQLNNGQYYSKETMKIDGKANHEGTPEAMMVKIKQAIFDISKSKNKSPYIDNLVLISIKNLI